jgi:hypothetical protein
MLDAVGETLMICDIPACFFSLSLLAYVGPLSLKIGGSNSDMRTIAQDMLSENLHKTSSAPSLLTKTG